MRIIFMGTPDFAVPSLEELIKSKYEVTAVFTQPDKPKGRGKKLTPPPIKEKALENNIPVFQPKSIKEPSIIDKIIELSPDMIVVVAYGQILPKKVLETPKLGCINVHASLLPKFRGAAPINWAIIKGEEITGVTTMYMEEGLDTGDMILKNEIEIGDLTAGELHDKLSVLGAELLVSTIEQIVENKAPREKQNSDESSYAPILDKALGEINWHRSAKEIYNLIRGVCPWPTAYTTYKGNKFKIWKAKWINDDSEKEPGVILEVNKEGIYVNTGKNILIIEELQFPGGKRMAVGEYIKGNEIEKNIRLGE